MSWIIKKNPIWNSVTKNDYQYVLQNLSAYANTAGHQQWNIMIEQYQYGCVIYF